MNEQTIELVKAVTGELWPEIVARVILGAQLGLATYVLTVLVIVAAFALFAKYFAGGFSRWRDDDGRAFFIAAVGILGMILLFIGAARVPGTIADIMYPEAAAVRFVLRGAQ